jgi:hypothetical protein
MLINYLGIIKNRERKREIPSKPECNNLKLESKTKIRNYFII